MRYTFQNDNDMKHKVKIKKFAKYEKLVKNGQLSDEMIKKGLVTMVTKECKLSICKKGPCRTPWHPGQVPPPENYVLLKGTPAHILTLWLVLSKLGK